MSYAFDDEQPQLWLEGQPFPQRVADHVRAGGVLYAHNAAFERVMWRDCAELKYDFPAVRMEQWFDTAAEAAAMSLPRKLEQLAAVLNLAARKDMEGHRLMQRMCRPRKFDDATGEPIWWDEPAKIKRLGEYCVDDVRVEQLVYKQVNRLNARERRIYLHHEIINDRGIHLDRELATAVRATAQKEIARQNALLSEATDGSVEGVTKLAKLKEWLATQQLEVDSLDKAALRELLDDKSQLSPEVRVALEARAEAAKSSLAKIGAMFDCELDGRMRGLLLYHGAGTGRATGKHVQPHNFPRGNTVKNVLDLVPLALEKRLVTTGEDYKGPSLMTILSALLRPMLTAAPGSHLMCADFASIEARVVAWVAGQDDLVAAFASGANIYKTMGSLIFNRPEAEIVKPSDDYTVSKNTVLGCGFGMGAKRFREQLWEAGVRISEELSETAITAYRERYPRIPAYWRNVNNAAIAAVLTPGEIQKVGNVRFVKRGSYLMIVLPARRSLAYANPKIVDRPVPWGGTRPAVEYSGISPFTHQWERMALYGGSITENIVQAIARDLLMDAALRVEDAHFPVVLTVHDEVLSEVQQAGSMMTQAQEELFMRLMKMVPEWAAGCPVDAEGWVGERYRK